ncbi:MAG: calcium/proton exchanger [Anaerolineaceae bacterium]|nr:calcium/proton exchanger [Anaerolineaceae bacterium]
MSNFTSYIRKNPLDIMILCIPAAYIAEWMGWGAIWVFILSAMGVIPMAGYIGKGTEVLASFAGPRIGGLLNATLGNAAELIITLIAIREGLLELVKASITGSILGNLLLVLGLSIFMGGIKNGKQRFDKHHAGNNSILLIISTMALVIPSLFSHYIGPSADFKVETLSLGVAGVMIVLYILGLIYSLKGNTTDSPLTYDVGSEHNLPDWSKSKAIIVLAISTFMIVLLSELLVGAVEEVVVDIGVSEFFLGIILIPIVGNVAEHLVAVQVAVRNHMELSVEIAISSSVQIALFVAPLLVFISIPMGNPLNLIFNQFEIIALSAGVLITALVSADGESNWLEGASLLAVYIILALAFFLLPA